MRRPEDLPVCDPGPFQPGEGRAIAEAVEQFLQQRAEPSHDDPSATRDYRPSDAPLGLVRRFLLQEPSEGDGESWIPWRELPDEIFPRASAAAECKRQLYQAHVQRQGRKTNLTVAEVHAIYAHEREIKPVFFDLSDVYLCLEADVLAAYEKRDHPDPSKLSSHPERTLTEEDFAVTRRVYQDSANWSRAVLELVGQALTTEIR